MTGEVTPGGKLSSKEAADLDRKIIKGIKTLEDDLLRFVEGRGWEVLGYHTFLRWWDRRVHSRRLGGAIRAVVEAELRAPDPDTGRQLTTREIGQRVGVSHTTVERDLAEAEEEINSGTDAPQVILKPTVQTDVVDTATAEVIRAEVVEKDPTSAMIKSVNKAKEMLLEVLNSPTITEAVLYAVVDDLIPEVESRAHQVEQALENG